MRTMRSTPPCRDTCATPGTPNSVRVMSRSTNHDSSSTPMRSDCTAYVISAPPIVTLVTSGSWMSCGRSERIRLTAARVSSSAPARSVSNWNSIAVVLTPSVTVEVTRLTPVSVAT
ncbi:hypothetical protein ACVWWW_000147 [Lysobacter sp. HA18]